MPLSRLANGSTSLGILDSDGLVDGSGDNVASIGGITRGCGSNGEAGHDSSSPLCILMVLLNLEPYAHGLSNVPCEEK